MGRGHKLFCHLSGEGRRLENIFGGTWACRGVKILVTQVTPMKLYPRPPHHLIIYDLFDVIDPDKTSTFRCSS